MHDERWAGVVGFPLYQVSSLGRVRSAERTFTRPSRVNGNGDHSVTWRARLIRGWVRRRGRQPMAMFVALRRNGETVQERIHRLVLMAFVGPCPAGMEGCHNDGNPLNNALDNLRWD